MISGSSDTETAAGDLLAAVYCLPPIDWWDGWTLLEELVVPTAVDEFDDGYTARLLLATALEAASLFVHVGWEGDGCWRAAPLPIFDDGCQTHDFMIAVKQANNGTTFLSSPDRLPWLEEYRCR
jgi:hypothetical protein